MIKPGNPDPAQLQALLQRDPKQPEIWLTLARIQARQGSPGEAERSLRQALKFDESFDIARLELAQLLVRNGFPGPGIVQAQHLLERNPANVEAWLIAGDAFSRNFQPSEAAMAYSRARGIAPDHEGAAYAQARLMLEQNQSKPAKAIVSQYLKVGSALGQHWWHLYARAQLDLQGPVTAKAVLDKALVAFPKSDTLQALAAKVRYQLGDGDWVQTLLAAAQNKNAHEGMVLTAAAALRGGGRVDAAQSLVEYKLHQIKKTLTDGAGRGLWLELADCYLCQGDFASGLKAAKMAQTLGSNPFPAPSRQLIDALLSLGQADEALPLIRQLRHLLPKENRWLAAEATALRALGENAGEQLFDTQRLVWVKDMPGDMWRSIQHALDEELECLHNRAGPLLDQSLRGGTQTSLSLLQSTAPAIVRLLRYFLSSVDEYRAQLTPSESHPFDQQLTGEPLLVGCWSVKLPSGGFHVNHLHSQGTLSSAFYVKVPSSIDAAHSQPHDRSGYLALGAPRFPVPGVGSTHWVQPRPGRLVLFPSWFWHGTVPFVDEQSRLSVAFDAIFR